MPGRRLRDLRHAYTSGLIAAGCDVVTVAAGAWPRPRQHHALDVLASVADTRGPDAARDGQGWLAQTAKPGQSLGQPIGAADDLRREK